MSESELAREIFALPEALERFRAEEGARAGELGTRLAQLRPAGVMIAARGSSDHAAVYAKYLLGARAGVPVALAAPSLFTIYARAPKLAGWVVMAISQSGASPDVVRVVALARAQGCATVALTDRSGSPLAAAAEHVIGLRLGGERAVAATGSFTTTLYALAHLVAGWRGPDEPALARCPSSPTRPRHAAGRARPPALAELRRAVIGRGGFPVALEGAQAELAGVYAEPSAADYRHRRSCWRRPARPPSRSTGGGARRRAARPDLVERRTLASRSNADLRLLPPTRARADPRRDRRSAARALARARARPRSRRPAGSAKSPDARE
jgi:glucosamine--fructose-6-phosphate aminotransferase (isomerizing)